MKNEIKNLRLTELQETLMIGVYAIRLASEKSNNDLNLSSEGLIRSPSAWWVWSIP